MGDSVLYDSVLRDGLNDAFSDAHSGWHTEDLVEKYQVTRDAQDRWALRSQQLFAAAQAADHFKSQIVSVEVPGKKGPIQFDKDEANRPDTTLEALARLKPAFRPNGTITAGNAPGLNDAAAAMVLADAAWADKRGLAPTARLVSYGIAAVEPGMFGLGPVPAVKQALQRAGWDIRSVERVEHPAEELRDADGIDQCRVKDSEGVAAVADLAILKDRAQILDFYCLAQ